MLTKIDTRLNGTRFVRIQGSDVGRNQAAMRLEKPQSFIERNTGYKPEAWSTTGDVIESNGGSNNCLVGASHLAFDMHWPLILSPDIIWATLLNGLSIHVEQKAESLRHHFVEHSGKAEIEIIRDEFVKGSPDNNWGGCFNEFSHKIKQHIGQKTHDLLVTEFSTTDHIAKAAFEVTMMDAMKGYFSYVVRTRCGIPYFDLEGTPDDWRAIRTKVAEWSVWDLDWWTKPLIHVLDNLVMASDGDADQSWWQNYYREHEMSGHTSITGWINAFFPYLITERLGTIKNECVDVLGSKTRFGRDPNSCDFPPSVVACPFIWKYFGEELPYRFLAGLMTLDYFNTEKAVKPMLGWAVAPDTAKVLKS